MSAEGADEDTEGHRYKDTLIEDEDVEGHVQPRRDTDLGGTEH